MTVEIASCHKVELVPQNMEIEWPENTMSPLLLLLRILQLNCKLNICSGKTSFEGFCNEIENECKKA
jgi:hypothetical protein